MLGVVDIGLGNNQSIYKFLRKIRHDYTVVATPNHLAEIQKLIFPGVGTFKEAATRLQSTGLLSGIQKYIENDGSYLGICLGMQLMARLGYEVSLSEGFGIFDAEVVRMMPDQGLALPHIGWNSVQHDGSGMFSKIAINEDFYFVHSYFMRLDSPHIHFNFSYGGNFTAYVRSGNAHGVQFHPEKSQKAGQQFLKNFLEC